MNSRDKESHLGLRETCFEEYLAELERSILANILAVAISVMFLIDIVVLAYAIWKIIQRDLGGGIILLVIFLAILRLARILLGMLP